MGPRDTSLSKRRRRKKRPPAPDRGTPEQQARRQALTVAPAITAYAAGQIFTARLTATNTSATPTLAVSGLPAKTITRLGGSALVAGDLVTGATAQFAYNANTDKQEVVSPLAASTGTGAAVRATSPTLTTPTLGVASATSLTLATGAAAGTLATPVVATGATGPDVKFLRQYTTGVSTSPVVILAVAGGTSGNLEVMGESGADRFSDNLHLETRAGVAVLSARSTSGSPAARTYGISSGALTLTMASGTYVIAAFGFGAIL